MCGFSIWCKYSKQCFLNHAVVLMYAANVTLDWLGDLRSWITRDYSRKPSSMVKTSRDVENQASLTTDCDGLQSSFTFPHSLSVNGSSDDALWETIQNRPFVLLHKVANSPKIISMTITEYRSCTLIAPILGIPKIFILWRMDGLLRDGHVCELTHSCTTADLIGELPRLRARFSSECLPLFKV